MNKFKLCLILVFLFFPVLVFAEDTDNNIFLECSSGEAKIGGTVNCVVSVISSVEVTGVEFELSADSGLSFTTQFNVPATSALQPYESGISLPNSKVALTKKTSSSAPSGSKFQIGSFTVAVNDSATVGSSYSVKLVNGALRDDTPNAIRTNINDSQSITVLAGSNDTTLDTGLKDLRVVSGGNLVPSFSKSENTFGVYLESATTTKFKLYAEGESASDPITASNTDTGEVIDLANDITFKPNDSGTMSIKVTVGTGDRATLYTLVVQRDKPSGVGEATLSSLMVGDKRVSLVSGTLDYTVELSEIELRDYVIMAELTDSQNFKFDNTDILSPHSMSGEQELEIKIVPKDSSSSYRSETYILKIVSSGVSDTTDEDNVTEEPENVNNNPKTGTASFIVMTLLLVSSFAASVYLYKRNMSQYNN